MDVEELGEWRQQVDLSTGAGRGNELGEVHPDFSEKFREKSVKSLQSRKGLQSGKL